MRRLMLAGNWKMYKTNKEAVAFINDISSKISRFNNLDFVIAPQFTALSEMVNAARNTNIKIASQNLYWEKEGAFTGEISPNTLLELGVKYAIIGHSERRQLFNETSDMVSKKADAAIKSGIIPIVCVGETLSERESGKTFEVLNNQVVKSLSSVSKENCKSILIAYEPVWAIGTGKTASPEQAQEAQAFIRKKIQELFGTDSASEIRILYGGSVKPENIKALLSQPDIDGGLIGGASLKADSYITMAEQASEIMK